jgi:hypothetical protein
MHCERMVMENVFPICEVFLLDTTAVASVLRKVLRGRPVVPPAKAKVLVGVAKARLSTRVRTHEFGPLI